jgi:hypothetical protein
MRFFPRTLVCALAAFVAGYGISRAWSSANSPGIKGIKTAIRNAQLIASAATSDGGATQKLIALCEQPGSLARDEEIFETLQKMSSGDFLRAVADFASLVDRSDKLQPNLRNMIAEAAIERWLEVDSDGMKQWLAAAQTMMKNLPGRGEVQLDLGVLQAITPALARNDPEWCMARIESMKGRQKKEALSGFLHETAKVDPSKARSIFAAITDDKEKSDAMQGLIGGLAESEPQAAINLIHGLSNTDAQREGRLAAIWSTGPRGAAAQIRRLPSQICPLPPQIDTLPSQIGTLPSQICWLHSQIGPLPRRIGTLLSQIGRPSGTAAFPKRRSAPHSKLALCKTAATCAAVEIADHAGLEFRSQHTNR